MAPQARLADKLLQLQAPTANSNSQPACLQTCMPANGLPACLLPTCQSAVTRRVLTLTLNLNLTLTADRACGDALRVSPNPDPDPDPDHRPRLRTCLPA